MFISLSFQLSLTLFPSVYVSAFLFVFFSLSFILWLCFYYSLSILLFTKKVLVLLIEKVDEYKSKLICMNKKLDQAVNEKFFKINCRHYYQRSVGGVHEKFEDGIQTQEVTSIEQVLQLPIQPIEGHDTYR